MTDRTEDYRENNKRHSKEWVSESVEETCRIAEEVLSFLASDFSSKEHATVLLLRGDLGVGKTAFSQCVGGLLSITDPITSPTFTIQKNYRINSLSSLGFTQFIHIDAYRLTAGSELATLGWESVIENKENLIFIEWPGNVHDILPKSAPLLSIDYHNQTQRMITLLY